MKAVVKKNGVILSKNTKVAKTFNDRVLGLMFKKNMDLEESLLIQPCNSIHTCFMNFPIDVIFLSKNNEVVHLIRKMKPWRFSLVYFRSKKVLELRAGTIGDDLYKGDQLEFLDV